MEDDMSKLKGRKRFYVFLAPALVLLLILIPISINRAVGGPTTGTLNVRTENDFVANPDIFAIPGEDLVAVFLESLDCMTLTSDTGTKGSDIIPYRYTAKTEQTFCWQDRDKTATHYMALVDDLGTEVVRATANGDCVTKEIEPGDYDMYLYHGNDTGKSVTVFIVPVDGRSIISTAPEETLESVSTIVDTDKCAGCDLSGANFFDADLREVDLSGAILDDAILSDANLADANLSGASLKNADLSKANLEGANLSGADLTGAILINAKLKNANLDGANLENADLAGTKLANAVPGALLAQNAASSLVSASGIFDETPGVVECNAPGAIGAGNGEDLEVTAACTVPAGTYHYRNVNIYNGGSLTFEDAVINFWAYNILIENDSSLIAGTSAAPIGTAGGKLTIHLYGDDQGNGGSGVACKTDVRCGVPQTIWDSAGASKETLPGGVSDYFYHYHSLPADTGDPNAYFGYKTLAVSYGGTLNLYGKKGATLPDGLPSSSSGTSWARLKGTVNVGATQLTVDRPVDWEAGDRLVLTTTDYLPGNSELLEIIAPAVSNTTFNFKVLNAYTGADIAGGLKHRHNGEPYPLAAVPSSFGIDLTVEGQPAAETRAAVGLLSRSIRVVSAGDTYNSTNPTCVYDCLSTSPATYHFGGHTSARQGFKQVQIQGVEFFQLGQGGRIGHYPVHFHMARETPSDTFVKDSSVWDSMTRFVTIHATHGVLLARNVGFMSIGHGFYLEDGTEINNRLYSNLGVLARAAVNNPQNPRQVPGILAWSGNPNTAQVPYNSDVFNPTVFWIMNGWNDFEYNMAAGATGCGVCYWLLSGANSGPSQGMKWESYASMQSGPVMTDGGNTYEVNFGRAGMTPLKSFVGNYCTSAMMSFNTVGATDACLGVSSFGAVTNPNAPAPKGDVNMETFYPKVDPGGGRFATKCDTTDCGPATIPNRCSVGDRSKCMVTVLDRYTSSFHWPQQNFASIWLRPQWYLVINSFLSDTQNGGLGFVTGGDYLLSSVIPGLWQLATRSVFVGHTQNDNPLASNAGPFNPLTSGDGKIKGLICDNADSNHCRSTNEGISIPIDNFGVNQRLYNIYDGPNYQDSNAFLDITETPLDPLCQPGGVTNCPQNGQGAGMPAWIYTRVLGIPINKTNNKCVLPNAAIGWKQPNGFFYPPAFHSEKLFFSNVDIRHYVLEPLWEPGTYETIQSEVVASYCTFPAADMFGNFSSVDRQTVLNDDDGSLTGLLSPADSPAKGETISVNLDPFFNAPVEAPECESFDTAKTSPYEYLSAIVYPGCVGNKDCGGKCAIDQKPCLDNSNCGGVCKIDHKACTTNDNCNLSNPENTCDFGLNACNLGTSYWSRPCTNASCYGVPLERQLLTSADKQDLSTTGIRMAGMDLYQRSMMTLNNGVYYIDTTVSEEEQRKSAQNVNVFKAGQTYYIFFVYAKPNTKQTYQIYVGEGLTLDSDVNIVRAQIAGFPLTFPAGPSDWSSVGWHKGYDPTKGILTVEVDMSSFAGEFADTKKDFCQPQTFCTPSGSSCVCSSALTGDLKTACENGNICGKFAGKDIDCPKNGCLGFSFKLPDGFDTDDKGNILEGDGGHRPEPLCFPSASPWDIELFRASADVAGSCSTTPINEPTFCGNLGGGPGTPPASPRPTRSPSPEPSARPTPAPTSEPTLDTDGDGVLDNVDSDNDNDGIPDELEHGSIYQGFFAAREIEGIDLDDIDGDGIPNDLDLDSDGDGLYDHEEAGGAGDPNNDGRVDEFLDSDGDGHHDAYDPETGGSPLPLPDSDGDGIPDFLDATNDGPTDGGSGGSDGGCAIAPPGTGTGGLFGMLMAYALIPAGIFIRRRLRSGAAS